MLPRVIFDPETKPGAENAPDAMHSNTSPANCRPQCLCRLKIITRYPVLGARPVFLDRSQCAVRVDMTGARAITQLAGSVMNVGVFVLLVRPRLVVAGVTASTVRLKRRVPPGNEFRVGLVASSAQQVAAVILWLVGQRRVTVVGRYPRNSDVAGIAFLGGAEVVRILAHSIHTIVAG